MNDAAVSLLIEIEDEIVELGPFDQGLALRDGAAAAADAKRYDDALRLFRKAEAVFAAKGGSDAMCIGLIIDEAIVLWELGERAAAIRRAGDALEAVEKIDPSTSRQNLRAHRMARAVVGFFMYLGEPYPKGPKPSVKPGLGSVLEGSAVPEPAELHSLAENWRVLESVEVDAGVDADIAKRSAARQGPLRVVSLESNLANAYFAKALRTADIDGAVRAIAPAVSLIKRLKAIVDGGGPVAFVTADIAELCPLSVTELMTSGSAKRSRLQWSTL